MIEDFNPRADAGGNQSGPAPAFPDPPLSERLMLDRLIQGHLTNPLPTAAGEPAAPASQHRLAAALARTPQQPARKPAMRVYLWMGAGLAASLLIAIGLTTWWRLANNPERLLAQAYGRSRTLDLRMPGAGFAQIAPPLHLRGGPGAREPSKLLEPRAGIQKRLEAAPQNAHWLELEARADVLEEQFDPAIQILDHLVAAGPLTSTLLLDDASAYFERGQFTGSDSDRAIALDYFRRADEMAPGDPVVLFDEALAMEDRGQLMNAVETWNRYLRFERDPPWLAEGRARLAALEKKLNELKTHQSRMNQHTDAPLATAAQEGPGPGSAMNLRAPSIRRSLPNGRETSILDLPFTRSEA
jgi:tetratricopeptide (TPR) repeat protein